MDSSGSEPTVLTIGTQTLFNENKYRVSQNGHRQWYLHIKHIRVSDKGGYMCQVNAKTMISQVGYLHVQGRREQSAFLIDKEVIANDGWWTLSKRCCSATNHHRRPHQFGHDRGRTSESSAQVRRQGLPEAED